MKRSVERNYVVYILECGDGTLYTGITNNLKQRLMHHQQGTGAKYTGQGSFHPEMVGNRNHPFPGSPAGAGDQKDEQDKKIGIDSKEAGG